MSLTAVRATLMDAWVEGGFSLPTAHENKAYTPPAKCAAYAELIYAPNASMPITFGTGGEDEIRGYMQVNIHVPVNTGMGVVMTHADALREFFVAGRNFTHNGQTVTILATGTKQGIPEGSWYITPVIITFFARIDRPPIPLEVPIIIVPPPPPPSPP